MKTRTIKSISPDKKGFFNSLPGGAEERGGASSEGGRRKLWSGLRDPADSILGDRTSKEKVGETASQRGLEVVNGDLVGLIKKKSFRNKI